MNSSKILSQVYRVLKIRVTEATTGKFIEWKISNQSIHDYITIQLNQTVIHKINAFTNTAFIIVNYLRYQTRSLSPPLLNVINCIFRDSFVNEKNITFNHYNKNKCIMVGYVYGFLYRHLIQKNKKHKNLKVKKNRHKHNHKTISTHTHTLTMIYIKWKNI